MIANKTKPKVCLLLREKGTNEKKIINMYYSVIFPAENGVHCELTLIWSCPTHPLVIQLGYFTDTWSSLLNHYM